MSDTLVTADVNQTDKKVILSSIPSGLPNPKTFTVKEGEKVEWQFRNTPQGFKVQIAIQFVGTPKPPVEPPLLAEGNILEDKGGVISGTVNEKASKGEYAYSVALVKAGEKPTPLVCFWSDSIGGNAIPTPNGMAGGDKSTPPR